MAKAATGRKTGAKKKAAAKKPVAAATEKKAVAAATEKKAAAAATEKKPVVPAMTAAAKKPAAKKPATAKPTAKAKAKPAAAAKKAATPKSQPAKAKPATAKAKAKTAAPAKKPAAPARKTATAKRAAAPRKTSAKLASKAGPQVFTVSHLNEADFKADGLRPYARYRDLGIAAATQGLCQAHVIRLVPPCTDEVRKRHLHEPELQLIYVLKGWIKNEFEGHGEQLMKAGTCWLQPPGIKHTVLDYSDDCEMLEIIVPADFKTIEL